MGKLTATLPDDLHQRIRQALEESGMTTSQFLNEAIQYFFNRDQKEDTNMAMRTLAFQIDEETFQRLKQYFRDYREMYGRNITQKEFCLGVILEALEEGEQEVREWREAQQREREKAYGEDEYEQEGPEEAPVSAEYDEGDPQPDESEQAATEDFSDDMEQEENVEGVSEDQSESEAAEFDEGAAEVAVEEQAESEAADFTEDTAEKLSEGDQQPDESEQAATEDFPDDLKQEENVVEVSEDQSESETVELDEGATEVAADEQAKSETAELTEDTAVELSEGEASTLDENDESMTEIPIEDAAFDEDTQQGGFDELNEFEDDPFAPDPNAEQQVYGGMMMG